MGWWLLFCCWFLCSALPFLSSPPPCCILVVRQFGRWGAIGGGGCLLVWACWALVVGCHLSVLVGSSLTISTHDPPCEQWLSSGGGGCWVVVCLWCGVRSCWLLGSGLSFVGVRVGWGSPSLSFLHPRPTLHRCCHSTHDPPHKQLLVRLGAGGALLSIVRCLWSVVHSVVGSVVSHQPLPICPVSSGSQWQG
jgi:hypothetical protein